MTAPDAPVAVAADVGAVVVAAGRGERLGASVPKAMISLGGSSLVAHAVARLRAAGVTAVVVAGPPGRLDELLAGIDEGDREGLVVVAGGATRPESVAHGLAALDPAAGLVLVHDAARALAPVELIVTVIDALRAGAVAVVPGLPVVDTIKQVAAGAVVATLDRRSLVAVQTPQGFTREVLTAAHAAAGGDPARLAELTDDASMVEAMGVEVHVVAGSPAAMKITRPEDLAVADLLLAADEVGVRHG